MVVVRINRLLSAVALCSAFYAGSAVAREIAMNTAQLQAMDKITGKVSIVEVPVNGQAEYGTFSIVVRSCKSRSPEETPENFAYVDVVDNYQTENPVNIFRGWMMSSSPALNAVAHPIYDVWLLKCLNMDVDRSKLLTEEELKIRNSIGQKAEDDKEPSLPRPRKESVAEAKAAVQKAEEEKVISGGSAVENPAVADEAQLGIEEEAEKAIAEFKKAKNADGQSVTDNKDKVAEPDLPQDEDAPKALIKINRDGTTEAPKYEEKPVAAPVEELPSDFIVIKKGGEDKAVAETENVKNSDGEGIVLTPEHEAMLPELLKNAKPISSEELENTEIHEEKNMAEEIPLVTGDEIEENGMIDEDQLIELEAPEAKLDIQAESLAE